MKCGKYRIAIALLLLTGCAGSQIKNLDTDMDVKGSTQDGTLGIRDRTAIIQKETRADDELRAQQWKNYSLQGNVDDEYYWLRRCREEIADSRLGGNGEVTELPEIDG